MNTKLHTVTDADGGLIRFFMTAGQVGNYTGVAALLDSLRKAERLSALSRFASEPLPGN